MTVDDDRGREHAAFADWDAAYVLGALSADDRHAYEDHLAGCELCRAAVGELAPLPGLLARVSPFAASDDTAAGGRRATGAPDEPDAPGVSGDPGVPETGGPGALVGPRADLVELVVRRERRHRMRRRLLVGGIAALFVAGVAVAVPLVGRGPAGPAQTIALEQRVGTTLTASVGLTPVAWGTRLSMDCTYPAGGSTYTPPAGAAAGPPVYTLVVTDVDGAQSQVSTWTAVPGQDVRLEAATAVPLDRIASLDVRSAGGATLLSGHLVTG
jgi:hypothetical protein